jgi:PAS domain S-box-containing protein
VEDKIAPKYNLEHFFELSPDWLCIAGFDGYFKKINPAVSKTLGYTEEELFSRPINSFVHPDDQGQTENNRDMIRKGQPLLNFDNRYMTNTGEIVWLTWTSMPIKSERVVFAIAKNITHRKRMEEYRRLARLLGQSEGSLEEANGDDDVGDNAEPGNEMFPEDELWLAQAEKIIRKHTGKPKLNVRILSEGLYLSERQVHRRIKAILGVTPNKFIRIIRLQMAREAIADGRHHTMTEISRVAGFETTAYFKKIFRQAYKKDII